jgi:HEAT repeat protein
MFQRTIIALGILVCAICLVHAQEEDTVLGKKRSEWLKLLKESKNPKARQGALLALAVIGPKEGVVTGVLEALVGANKDADANVRREAINVLTGMGKEAKGAVDALGEALAKDKSDIVREAAARSLAKFGLQAESQVLILARALEDKHAGTRAAAAETLNELGEKARPALPHLLKVLANKDSDRFTRTYAALILVKISDEPRKIVPALITALSDKDAPVKLREALVHGLALLGPEAGDSAEVLAKILGEKTEKVELRRSAAVALAKVGAKANVAWPAAKIALGDKDNSLRNQAIRLAGAYAKEEKAVVPALADAAVKDDNTENRLAAIQELGQLGNVAAEAVPTLTRLATGDSRASIREAAEDALKKIKASP